MEGEDGEIFSASPNEPFSEESDILAPIQANEGRDPFSPES